jgi:hypothetical protein
MLDEKGKIWNVICAVTLFNLALRHQAKFSHNLNERNGSNLSFSFDGFFSGR